MVAMPPDSIELAAYHPWRRGFFFLIGLCIGAAAVFAWLYTRPPEYIAVSQLRIFPAATLTDANAANPQDRTIAFLTEVQVLTSQAVLKDALVRLRETGGLHDLGPDPAGAAQRLLRARPLEQTQVVELSAKGPEPGFLVRLLNAVTKSWQARATRAYQQQVSAENDGLKKQADDLHTATMAAQAKLDEFREANGFVANGAENALVADVQNLSTSYTTALASFAKAQAHLQMLQNVSAAGAAPNASQSDPAIAALEQKAAELRDQLNDLRRRFTPQYLALDAETRSLPDRVAALDGQIAAQRNAGRAADLRATDEQVQASQLQLERLSGEVSAKQKQIEDLAARRAEDNALQADLDRAQTLERSLSDRAANLQTVQRERAPRLEVLQTAQFSVAPIRRINTTNAPVALAAALSAGVLAALLSKLLDDAPALAWTAASRRRYPNSIARIGHRAGPRQQSFDHPPSKFLPAPTKSE